MDFVDAVYRLKAAIDGVRSGLSLAKDVLAREADSSEDRARAIREIETAELQFEVSLTERAQELGYELCRCVFPPSVMLTEGDVHRCQRCARTKPLPLTAAQLAHRLRQSREVMERRLWESRS
jgi:hypothetical protein